MSPRDVDEDGPCSQRLVGLVRPLLPTGWLLQRSFDVGGGPGEFAVACVVFIDPDGGSLNVTLQRPAAPHWVEAVAMGRDHALRTTRSGAELVLLEVPKSFRQVVLKRSTSLMINVTTSGVLGRGVPVPYSLPELELLVSGLDNDQTESVFPPPSSGAEMSWVAGAVHVPSVVGMRLERARDLLSHVGLASTIVEDVNDSGSPDATAVVVRQEPQGGGLIDRREAVHLQIVTT